MPNYSYRFNGTSFTGEKYTYRGPSTNPCSRVLGPSAVEMKNNGNWELSGNNSYVYGSSRGILFGGGVSEYPIQYLSIESSGSSYAFGDLLSVHAWAASCSSSTEGIVIGGEKCGGALNTDMEYVTISTLSNSSMFGEIFDDYGGPMACSNSLYGVFNTKLRLHDTVYDAKRLNYVTFASKGNSSYFGDLTHIKQTLYGTSACASPTLGIFFSVNKGPSWTCNINSIIIGTSGESTDFGDMSPTDRISTSACSSSTRGIYAGGLNTNTLTNSIKYIEIAETGSVNNFGTLSVSKTNVMSCSSKTKGILSGGDDNSSTYYTSMEQITIATTGSASNFGDLIEFKAAGCACSNCHGGLS